MKEKSLSEPCFFVDSLPDIIDTDCKELIRSVEIQAHANEIFLWLKQLRVAPYSYDFIDNRRMKSPDFIIENLPPLKANIHFLLACHVTEFAEDSFIICRFCQPVNLPFNLSLRELFIEYRISAQGSKSCLWCKVKGYIRRDILSRGFFHVFSLVNKIMMTKQLKNIKKFSERLSAGEIRTGKLDVNKYYARSGIHWWIFCRRKICNGLIPWLSSVVRIEIKHCMNSDTNYVSGKFLTSAWWL